MIQGKPEVDLRSHRKSGLAPKFIIWHWCTFLAVIGLPFFGGLSQKLPVMKVVAIGQLVIVFTGAEVLRRLENRGVTAPQAIRLVKSLIRGNVLINRPLRRGQ